jgi:hypothetical protein
VPSFLVFQSSINLFLDMKYRLRFSLCVHLEFLLCVCVLVEFWGLLPFQSELFFCLVAAGSIDGRGMVLQVFMHGLSYLWYFVLSYISIFLLLVSKVWLCRLGLHLCSLRKRMRNKLPAARSCFSIIFPIFRSSLKSQHDIQGAFPSVLPSPKGSLMSMLTT